MSIGHDLDMPSGSRKIVESSIEALAPQYDLISIRVGATTEQAVSGICTRCTWPLIEHRVSSQSSVPPGRTPMTPRQLALLYQLDLPARSCLQAVPQVLQRVNDVNVAAIPDTARGGPTFT